MIQDRVDTHRGLAGLAVADDEFALSTTDWGHGVDGLDASLQRLVHGLTTGNAGSLNFHTALHGADERALAVDGFTECVHDATKKRVANRHRKNATSGTHW